MCCCSPRPFASIPRRDPPPPQQPALCAFADLAPFVSEDVDQDFFHNITHVQLHRRAKAMKRLAVALARARTRTKPHPAEDSEAWQPKVGTIIHILLPLCLHPLYECEKGAQLDTVLPDAVDAIRGLCAWLPWSHYHTCLRQFVSQLSRKGVNERVVSSALCAVIDAFHFPVTMLEEDEDEEEGDVDGAPNGAESTAESSAQAGGDDGDDGDDEQEVQVAEDATEEEGAGRVLEAAATSEGGALLSDKVWRDLKGKVLPALYALLIVQRTGRKGERIRDLRANVAIAMVKLVAKLPQEALQIHLPRLVRVFVSLCLSMHHTY